MLALVTTTATTTAKGLRLILLNKYAIGVARLILPRSVWRVVSMITLFTPFGWLAVGARVVTVLSLLAWVAPFMLGLMGFGGTGVIAGSLASWVQAARYGALIPFGSLFSLCQSFAMGGMAGAEAVAAWQAVSVVSAVIGGGLAWLFSFA